MTTVTEIPVGELKRGDMFDLVNEVVRVWRRNDLGFIKVKCNAIDRRTGATVMFITRSYFPHETVLREDVAA